MQRPYSANLTPLGLNLKKIRKARGWNQDEGAEAMGIPKALLGAYEEGRAYPRVPGLISIAEKLGVDDLMGFLKNPDFKYKTPAEL